MGRFDTESFDALEHVGLSGGDDRPYLVGREGGKNHAGRIASDARHAQQRPKNVALFPAEKAVKPLRILAHDEMRVQPDLGPIAYLRKSLQRYVQPIAYTSGLQNGRRRRERLDPTRYVLIHNPFLF